MIHFILNLVFGILAGWIAGRIMNSEGGTLRNLILGLCGGVVGSIVLGIVGIHGNGGRIASLIISVLGACILIWLGDRLSKK